MDGQDVVNNVSCAPENTCPARTRWSRREGYWLAGILILGAALRVWYLLQVVQAPDFQALRQDLDVQDYQARAMVTGDWTLRDGVADPEIRTTPYYRPPGYPYYLAAIYWLTGGSYLAPRIVNMIMGLGSVVLMFLLGRLVFGSAVGLIAAFFMATYWAFPYFEGEVNDPSIFVFLVPCLMLFLRLWAGKRPVLWAILTGLTVGCYALMRPNILLFGPVIAFWMLYKVGRGKRFRRVLPSWCGLAFATALVILPVTVRNYVVSGEFVPISTYFGENFLIGNGEDSDGYTSWTPYLQKLEGTGNFSVWVYPNIVRGLGKELGIEHLTHSEASRIFFRKTLDYIKTHKMRTLKLLGKKCILFWSPVEITGNKVVQYEKEYYPPLKYLPGFALVMALWSLGAVLFLLDLRAGRVLEASPGGAVRSTEMAFLFFSFILVYFASFLPFFVNSRARVPILGLCFLIGAYGLCRIGQFVASGEYRKSALAAGALVTLYLLFSAQYVPYKPDRARWHYGRADSYLRSGRVDEALAEADRMLALPEHSMPYMPFRLGHAFAKLGKNEAAVRLLRAALGPSPETRNVFYREDLYFHIGCALATLGKLDEAANEFRQAIELLPDDARPHNDLGLVLERQGRTAEALHEFEEALRATPDFALAHTNLGDLLGRLGEHEKAVEHFARAVEAAPDNPFYRYNLAIHLADAGRIDEAVAAYEKASELDPKDPRPYNNQGLLLAAQGREDDAIAQYREALRVAPGFTLAYANWGNLLVAQGKFDEGVAVYEQGIAAYPKDAALHNGLGYLYARHGDVDKAQGQYEEALRLSPSYVKAHTNLAYLLASQGKAAEALAQFRQAVEAAPEDPEVQVNLADMQAQTGAANEAIETYRKAIEMDSGNVRALLNLGTVLAALGRADEAAKQFERVLEIAPDNARAREKLEQMQPPAPAGQNR